MDTNNNQLSYGLADDGTEVLTPRTNIIVTGRSGAGATITMRSLVADAVRKGWKVALASPKYRADADYPGADDSESVDMKFYSDGRGEEDEAFGIAWFIDQIPTGFPGTPRLVVVDDFQSLVYGFDKAKRRAHFALDRLLDDPDTVVVLRMTSLSVMEVPQYLSRRIGAVISMGRANHMNAVWSMTVGNCDSPEPYELLTQLDPEAGRGVLLTQGSARETFTPFVDNVVHG